VTVPPISFEDSRRLTGASRHFAGCGAVLEAIVGVPVSDTVAAMWRADTERAAAACGWMPKAFDVRPTPLGASFAIAAPIDQLFTATEINEWAWQRANGGNDGFHAPGHAAIDDLRSALETLRRYALAERNPPLCALHSAAAEQGVAFHADDALLSLGEGAGCRLYEIAALPAPDAVPWSSLGVLPKALVTGSNGKTTSVRLIAAMCRANGWRSGHTCTDGLFVDGVQVEAGDFSGPAGARSILRRADVDAAVLETARGGLLRRGLAIARAEVALVTNVSVEHFGEYGIHDLGALADVKLSLSRAIDAGGHLVLNADDALLLEKSRRLDCPLAWFALDDAHPELVRQRARGGSTCGVGDGRLRLSARGAVHDLGAIAAMPLALGGDARYNVANLAGAALTAFHLGIAVAPIASVLASFGNRRDDNPGRLQRWRLGGAQVLLDYAHNPDGLEGFLDIATRQIDDGRLGLLLGQAGNRDDDDVRALADVAARHRPRRVVLKDIDGFLRGRVPGEIPGILAARLIERGIPDDCLLTLLDEAQAARELIGWARPGDVIALPVHGTQARATIVALLDRLEHSGWQAGMPLPAEAP
jgi:cyanophycin synthetase